MAKYEVEFACFRKVVIEAESEKAANDKAAIMEDEEIDRGDSDGYIIWNEARKI